MSEIRLRLRAALALLLAAATGFPLAAAPSAAGAKPARPKSPVLVVGWDGGDWYLLDELVKRGVMPNLASLVERGRTWTLESFNPMISPLIWTTIATGRSPVDHGVADFQELDPATRSRIPISGSARKVPALWNAASRWGLKVGVVGWWATWPAEKVSGFLVSDRAAPVLFSEEALRNSPALTFPEGLADGVRIVGRREGSPPYDDVAKALRVTRAEFDAAVAAKKDLRDPVTGYQKILGSMRVYARSALDLYDRERPDLLMAYFQGTDEIGHLLGRFHPPKLPTVTDEEFRKYSGGAVQLYREADAVLGELLARARRDGGTIVLLSDHGFRWGETRPKHYSSIQFDTAHLWHEVSGILAVEGPLVVPSKTRGKATIFDVAPTLCRLLGLPADPKFEGKPVAGLSPRVPPARPAVSWAKEVPVERLLVRPPGDAERKAAEEFTKKLISLGYLTGAEAAAVDARPPDRRGTETAASFQNVATYLREKGDAAGALPWYRKALEVNPKSPIVWYNMSFALQALDRTSEADEALINSARYGYYDPDAAIYRRVTWFQGKAERSREWRRKMNEFLEAVVKAFPENDMYRASRGK